MIGLFTRSACRSARARMLDGIAGRLDVRARLDVQDHVASCASCARELADLAAGDNAARRALGRYRWLRARAAPGRSRLIAYRGTRPSRLAALFGLTRRTEPLIGVAMIMLVILGANPGGPSVEGPRLPVRHTVRSADEFGGLVRVPSRTEVRIPVLDGIVIDETSMRIGSTEVDRAHPGPQ